jgi:Domain of unknown function (DUF4416)
MINASLSYSKLFVGVLAPKIALQNNLIELTTSLEQNVGTIQEIWADVNGWSAPESYMQEMGEDLSTAVIVFDGLWHPLNLAFTKKRTEKIEESFSKDGRSRVFNINPGMIDKVSMRLASHKPSPRRYQISENVWVEDQMSWHGNKLEPKEYSFQEYLMGSRYSLLRNLSAETIERAVFMPDTESMVNVPRRLEQAEIVPNPW